MIIMAELNIAIEDFVAPEAAPHKLAPVITQLIEANAALEPGAPSKVATVTFKTEEEGIAFVQDFQRAARQQGVSGKKRAFTVDKNGVYTVSMGVGDKITRTRGAKPGE